jgi:hypothetical protein
MTFEILKHFFFFHFKSFTLWICIKCELYVIIISIFYHKELVTINSSPLASKVWWTLTLVARVLAKSIVDYYFYVGRVTRQLSKWPTGEIPLEKKVDANPLWIFIHYYKMWVQFISPHSLDQWIHCLFTHPRSLQPLNSLIIKWNHSASKDTFCCSDI